MITLRTGFADDEVWVEVADTGHGIGAEVQKPIFDPFFTTKDVGKGRCPVSSRSRAYWHLMLHMDAAPMPERRIP